MDSGFIGNIMGEEVNIFGHHGLLNKVKSGMVQPDMLIANLSL